VYAVQCGVSVHAVRAVRCFVMLAVSVHAVRSFVTPCMEYEVEGARPRGRPKKTWREIVEKTVRRVD